nr:4286_t:CDS:10 [Entrophospora candida]
MSSSEGLQVVFKISFLEEKILRRVSFPQLKDITYSALHSKLSNLYNMTDFRIRYNDEEDDLITIDNELDLQECFSYLLKINNKDSDKLIVRLTLSQENPQKTRKNVEYVVNENQGEIDGFGLEKVINEGFANFQNIIQTIVTDVSNTLENDLNNLHATLQQPFQQAINTVNSNETEQIIKQEQIISQGPVIHNGVICDCCEKIIRGMRWKCLTCSNYDLCQDCKSKQPTIHNHANSHEFKPIPYPQNYCSSNSKRITASLHSAVCDFCESQIYGTRHKCINCPDFDLCNGCISLAPTQHPNHTFMPIYRPGEPEIKLFDAVSHPGIRCDGCEKLIIGVRFKCANCPNFDFCGNCEASPLNTHDITHIFLKVKFPVSIPIPSSYPLLSNYYVRRESKINTTVNGLTGKQEYPKEKKSPSINNDTDASEDSSINQPAIVQPSIKVESHAPIDLYKHSLLPSIPSTPLTQTLQHEIFNPYTLGSNQIDNSNSIFSGHVEAPLKRHENSLLETKLESRFVEDVNFPDGTTLVPRAQFIKKWRMENVGNVAWPESTVLTFVGGAEMFGDNYSSKNNNGFYVGLVNVGEIKEVFAELQAPSESGEYISYWRLVDGEGNKFGHRLWCSINVEDDDSNMTASSMIFPVMKNEQVPDVKQEDNIVDSIATSEFYYDDSDIESDISSLSSLENSQDYYFVEKDDHLSDENDQKEAAKEKIVKEVVFEADNLASDDDDIESDDDKDSKDETENQSEVRPLVEPINNCFISSNEETTIITPTIININDDVNSEISRPISFFAEKESLKEMGILNDENVEFVDDLLTKNNGDVNTVANILFG